MKQAATKVAKKVIDWLYKNKSVILPVAIVVTMVTTYLLVLPAFTLEKEEAKKQGGIDVPQIEETAEVETKEQAAEEDKKDDAKEDKAEAAPAKALIKEDKELTKDGKDYTVSVTVGSKAEVPEDTELQVSEIKEKEDGAKGTAADGKDPAAKDKEGRNYSELLKKAEKVLSDKTGSSDIKSIRFYDISLMSGEDEVEPSSNVDVKITLDDEKKNDKKDYRIIHFTENGPEIITSKTDGNAIKFTTDGFSVYAVVEEGTISDESRMTLNFYNGNQLIATVYVKNADDTGIELEQIIHDPGAGDMGSGELFKGWILDKPNYTTEDVNNKMDIVGIQNWAKGKANADEIVEGEVHNFYAMIFKTFSVTFKDEDGITIKSDALITRAADESIDYTINVPYTPKEQDEVFQGWHGVYSDGELVIAKGGSTQPFPNGTVVEISDHATFTVEVPKGYWLAFNENGRGATYTPPQFIPAEGDTVTVSPPNPSRQGYEFIGWNTEADGSGQTWTASDFGDKIREKTTLYAQWRAVSSAPYTVIVWKQNIDGNGYDFAESIHLTGIPGQDVTSVSQREDGDNAYARIEGRPGRSDLQITGFHLDRFDHNVEITPEGNAVVNVYYDRNEYTLRFQVEGAYQESSSTSSGWYYVPNGSGGYDRVYLTRLGDHWTYETGEYEYTYTPTTSNNGTQYGIVNGEYVQLTRHGWNNYYWTYNDGWWEGPRYNGTRYLREETPITATYDGPVYTYNSGWTTIKEITALYEQNISDQFPIVGNNGVTYDNGERWMPQSNNQGWRQVMVFIETMPAESVTFHLDVATRPLKTMYYYVEALPTDTQNIVIRNGKRYVLYNRISARYNGVTTEDFVDLDGFTKVDVAGTVNGQTLTPDGNGFYIYNTTQDQNIYFFYSRDSYPINYMDGVYLDGYDNVLDEPKDGQLHVSDNIYYQADITSYNKGGSNYYQPTKAGYVFEGWYLDDAGNTPANFTKMQKGGMTVYAKWRKIQYRVFLHPNVPTSDTSFSMGGQESSFRVNYGEKIAGGNDIQGIRDDYELIGWYTDPACTQSFNFDAYELNDTTVTTSYDKTENTETDKYGNPTQQGNKDKDPDLDGDTSDERFWINRKLDLYAKWRAKIEGAPGINVQYDAVEGQGVFPDGSTIHGDPLTYYLDRAQSNGYAASVATDTTKQFLHWVVQRWDESQQKFVDTDEIVYPSDIFEVRKDYAKVETITPDPSTPDVNKKYTVQLRAEYGDKIGPTPTHIWWFPNDKDTARHDAMAEDNNLQINQPVPIVTPEPREGYRFLGWARVDSEVAESSKDGAATPTGKILDLGYDDLFLTYHEAQGSTAAYYTASIKGAPTKVSQVAADEDDPYHDMYAVWEKSYKVKVKKVVDGLDEDKTIDFTFNHVKRVHNEVIQGDPFTLKHNEENEIYNDIPEDSHFSVTETANEYFDISVTEKYTDDEGNEHEITGLSNGCDIVVRGDTEITVTNKRKTKKIKIFKVDDSDTPVPLKDATFTIGSETLTTDTTGYTDVVELKVKNNAYDLNETAHPTGYRGLDEAVPVTIGLNDVTVPTGNEKVSVSGPDSNNVYTITVINTLVTVPLRVVKVDQKGSALENAVFSFAEGSPTFGDGTTPMTSKIPEGKDYALIVEGQAVPLGTYTIKEDTAPDGYYPIKGDIEIKLEPKNDDIELTVTIGGQPIDPSMITRDTETGLRTIKIKNTAGVELPMTGGSGTTWMYVLGALMVVMSIILLVARAKTKKSA